MADDDLPSPAPGPTAPAEARADAPPRRRGRLALGLALLAVGVGATAVAWWAADGGGERPVGELVASDLPGVASSTTPAESTTSAASATSAPTTSADPGSTTSEPAPPSDGKPNWPRAVRGRPPAFGGDGDAPPTAPVDLEDGAYLWNDFNGWHLWIVGADGSDATVEVVSDDELAKAEAVGGSPSLVTEADRLVLGRGGDPAPVVGVDFNPGFYAKELTVTVTGDLPLHLGSRAEVAPSPTVLAYAVEG